MVLVFIWLISWGIPSRSIHAVTKGKISFSFHGQAVFHCVHVPPLFYHSSIHGYLGCFCTLAIVHKAAVNTGVHFKLVFWIWGDIFPEVELLGHKAITFLIFKEPLPFSIVFAPICIPINSAWMPFLHILTNTCLLMYWWWTFWQVWGDISLWF